MPRFLLFVLLSAVAMGVSAQNEDDQKAGQAERTDSPVSGDSLPDRNCLRSTGSRITEAANARAQARGAKQAGKRQCAPVSGRSYSRDDIDRTGQTNVADALRMLDPSVN